MFLRGSLPSYDFSRIPKINRGFIAPNGTVDIPSQNLSVGPLTAETIEQIKNGDVHIIAKGKITYIDIFDRPHWLTYCYELTLVAEQAWAVCDKYNETGDGSPPP